MKQKWNRRYYDDLGGAYYFLPRNVINGRATRGEIIFEIVCRLILILVLGWLLFHI